MPKDNADSRELFRRPEADMRPPLRWVVADATSAGSNGFSSAYDCTREIWSDEMHKIAGSRFARAVGPALVALCASGCVSEARLVLAPTVSETGGWGGVVRLAYQGGPRRRNDIGPIVSTSVEGRAFGEHSGSLGAGFGFAYSHEYERAALQVGGRFVPALELPQPAFSFTLGGYFDALGVVRDISEPAAVQIKEHILGRRYLIGAELIADYVYFQNQSHGQFGAGLVLALRTDTAD
jgi:hypothetical protein